MDLQLPRRKNIEFERLKPFWRLAEVIFNPKRLGPFAKLAEPEPQGGLLGLHNLEKWDITEICAP